MSTKVGAIRVSAHPRGVGVWTALVAGIAVTALILSAVALGLAVRARDRGALPAPRTAIAPHSAVTGTGPGLVELARETMRTAALSGIYSGSSVTGTGPGLLQVAFDHSVPQMTGTGPGLVQLAEESSILSGRV